MERLVNNEPTDGGNKAVAKFRTPLIITEPQSPLKDSRFRETSSFCLLATPTIWLCILPT